MVFIFGYVTCHTFYFLNNVRLSLKLIKSSRIIYLLMAVRAVENYVISERVMKKYLSEIEKDNEDVKKFQDKCEEELEYFRKQAINHLIQQTPDAFKPGLEFEDWKTAMLYLQRHKQEALEFWRLG